ncbi:MAG: prepilin-type N-terminal cleavage/methylation domain-containing protein [Candidatus Gastranaerophilales bacterium]|nr:prepilin-type N-terminal cleavage/methylation domain-containing protein [Candidatus Gastranaerophilales bacterium]
MNIRVTRKPAFTLAEVLITLVIIGVIAAITVPTLMANYKQHEADSRKKKFLATLTQAVRLAEIDMGATDMYSASRKITGAKNTGLNDNAYTFLENTILKYMPVEKVDTEYTLTTAGNTDGTYSYSQIYTLNDGSAIVNLCTGGCGAGSHPQIWYDTNGLKKPNQLEKDVFRFKIKFLNNGHRGINVCDDSDKCYEQHPNDS